MKKAKPKYIGSIVVVRQTARDSYILAKLTGAILALRYTVFYVISYHPQSIVYNKITKLVEQTVWELDKLVYIHLEEDLPSNPTDSD